MSNEENNKQSRRLTEVVITPEDVRAAMYFWSHFNIPKSAEFSSAIENFCANPNVETQRVLQYQLGVALTTTEHEVFNDDLFKTVNVEIKDALFELQFDQDINNLLADDQSKNEQ